MINYLIRRVLYAMPILIGVNLITFALFFFINTPDDIARMQLGQKRVTPEAIERWKQDRGYDKPLLYNAAAPGASKLTDTVFFRKSVSLFWFDFGRAEDGRDIGNEIRTRMGPSLAIAIPSFVIGLACYVTFALVLAFFRATYVDFVGVVLCVAAMSISGSVLHHRRAVPGQQAVEPGPDLGLRRRDRRLEVRDPAGGDRAHRQHR